jgi:type VI secretion system protein ImpK
MQSGYLVDLATDLIKLIGSLSPIPPVDDEGLRLRFLDLLAEFQARGVRAGYAAEQMDAARFAVVALIDERVLSLDAPIRSAWSATLLQQHLFSTRNANEVFFDRLAIFRPPGSPERADVLEVFHLCLCLGFRGRYREPAMSEARRHLIAEIAKEVRTARMGVNAPLSPAWEPRGITPRTPHPGRWCGIPLWTVPLILAALCLVWWFATSAWANGVIERFAHDFPVR